MNGYSLELVSGIFGASVGFGVAWIIRTSQLAAQRRMLAEVEQARLQAMLQVEELRTERAGLQVRVDEKGARIAEQDLALKEKAATESLAVDLRERMARLTAESEGLQRTVEERDKRIGSFESEKVQERRQIVELREQKGALEAAIEAERRSASEKLAILSDAEAKLREAFKALSAEALRENNQSFLELAKTQMGEFQQGASAELEQRRKAIDELVTPMRRALEQVDTKLQDVEKVRAEAYGALTTQLQSVAETQRQLHTETSNLVRALRAPSVRGRWGEMQLRRVVELAGMAEHCDFTEQPIADSPEGRLRPDLVVHLPAGKQVVVDAKVPLDAYLRALEAPDELSRLSLLRDHARQVRDHMTKLSAKSYWDQFAHTPDHVVMFIPGEVFFFAALQHDPELIEYGVSKNVFVAGPTTLISLLRTVAYGWRQECIAQNAEAISRNGRELYERIATLADHLRRLGGALARSVEAYNQAIGSLETRVMVGARRFKELGAAGGPDLDQLEGIERTTRHLQASEFQVDQDGGPLEESTIPPNLERAPEESDHVPF